MTLKPKVYEKVKGRIPCQKGKNSERILPYRESNIMFLLSIPFSSSDQPHPNQGDTFCRMSYPMGIFLSTTEFPLPCVILFQFLPMKATHSHDQNN